jgi:hypothetical protein
MVSITRLATYGFYCNAPGGILVEVSTMNISEPAYITARS